MMIKSPKSKRHRYLKVDMVGKKVKMEMEIGMKIDPVILHLLHQKDH
jgi:hypothetical protein